MTEEFNGEALSAETRSAIHDFALNARQILMTEARDMLEGVYGLRKNGTFEPPENLPALIDPAKRETYRQLAQYIEYETSSGLERNQAVDKLVKEIAFTHLNRLVAFRILEERKLIREAVRKGNQSNGFKFYLADHPNDEELWRTGNADEAYAHFLLWQSEQISTEIAELFDPTNLVSRLFPRPAALSTILSMVNSEKLAPAWQVEETIGWIYQYFNEPELQAAFAAVRLSGDKFEAEDIPAATQLFTLHWVVRYLVENTLGRLWVRMHPDSQLKEKLRYLVPLSNDQEKEPLRPIENITLLDPACGSMHFGLVAFDLFVEMYREELINAGSPGWPQNPSVPNEEEIPAAVLKNNLYGIDIDLRAVQLSALALYLRAKRYNKNVKIKEHHLACADVFPFNTADMARFIVEMRFSNPIFERMLRRVREQLINNKQLGSLLRIERGLHDLVEEVRLKGQWSRTAQRDAGMIAFPEIEASDNEQWYYLEAQLYQALDHFRKTIADPNDQVRFFTQEADKSFHFLDLMLRQYDVVVTNPPYLSRRKMNKSLADLLDQEYPEGKGDLYAAFIQRALELANEHGYVGMLTMHSFMFISSYEELRNYITGQAAIQTVAHMGPGLFATGNPGTLQTVAFVLRREPDPRARENSVGTYFRLVHEPDADAKRLAFEKSLAELKQISENKGE